MTNETTTHLNMYNPSSTEVPLPAPVAEAPAEGVAESELRRQADAEQLDYLEDADLPALFAARMPVTSVHFRIGGIPCRIDVRMMDADHTQRYKDAISKFSTKDEGDESRFYFEPAAAKANLILLLGSVVGWDITTKITSADGAATRRQSEPFPNSESARADYFSRMVPALHDRLVNTCKRVNGLAPK